MGSSENQLAQWDPWVELCAEINKDHGCKFVSVWEDSDLSEPKHRLSTGSYLLDMCLGGGLPTGRIIEVYGWEGIGKSTICSHVGASAQAIGGFYVKLDAEVAGDKKRDIRLGVIPDRYFYVRCDSVEKGFELIQSTIKKIRAYPERLRVSIDTHGLDKDEAKLITEKAKQAEDAPIVVAWDSIAATPTDDELSGETYASGMMSKPRKIREGLRKLTNIVAENHVCLIMVNHLIESLDKGYGPKEKTPCGHAIDFWSSVQLRLRKSGKFVIGNRQIGLYVKARVEKSKVSPPMYECIFPLNYLNGIDKEYEAFDYLYTAKKYVTQTGGWYYIHDYPKKGSKISLRYADLHKKLEEDPKLFEFLIEKMREIFYGV